MAQARKIGKQRKKQKANTEKILILPEYLFCFIVLCVVLQQRNFKITEFKLAYDMNSGKNITITITITFCKRQSLHVNHSFNLLLTIVKGV